MTVAPGFVAAGVHSGVKEGLDLALVATADREPVAAAGVFTHNKVTAAPVLVSRHHLAATGGHAVGVVLNSGNANAATGEQGMEDARRMCATTAKHLGRPPEEVLVCSTGLIGIPLPIELIDAGIGPAAAALSPEGGDDAAKAIMTTDTVPKQSQVAGEGFTVAGLAKGAAMLRPDMATMLAVLTTDAGADPYDLIVILREAVATSFNRLSIDGAQSTNDTVLLLAGGPEQRPTPREALQQAVSEVCADLAQQMADDAEGSTKTVRIRVVGAASDEEALVGARRVAENQLIKCSWYGKDPYWGRIASELGVAGIELAPDKLRISYGGIVANEEHDAAALAAYMEGRHIEIVADLGVGHGRGEILTTDLTHAYVDENMGTS